MPTHFVAVTENEPDSAFGVWFPDVEGCFSAGDTLDEAVVNAASALRQHIEVLESAGRMAPNARPVDDILCDEDVRESVAAGAVLFAVPLIAS